MKSIYGLLELSAAACPILQFALTNGLRRKRHISATPNNSSAPAGAPLAEVTEALKKAEAQPNDFKAQLDASDLCYQIRRYDEAARFCERAGKEDNASLEKNPNHELTLQNPVVVLREKGDAKAVEKTTARLAKINPCNPLFKSDFNAK